MSSQSDPIVAEFIVESREHLADVANQLLATHLVRNSIDHGIESPEHRIRSGKPAAGAIVLRAFHQAGKVNISISDDETGHLRDGLVVDGLHDSEEIVVKPLGRHMQDCRCLAGATILGDGRVALILDVAGIASRVELALPNGDELAEASDAHTVGGDETQTVLLFTNDPAEQFGIPMAVIARLERVLTDQIDSVGGREVLQYGGTSLPLFRLEDHIKASPPPDTSNLP